MKSLQSTTVLPSKPTHLSSETRETILAIRDAVKADGQDTFCISKSMVPTGDVLVSLQERSRHLSQWLGTPAGLQAVQEPIAFMLGMLKLRDADEADARLTAKAYHAVMCDLPLWAVKEACMEALRGNTGDRTGRWAPLPGELRKTAERVMLHWERERADIDRILIAKVREPIATTREERAAIVAKVLKMTRSAAAQSEMKDAACDR